MNQTRTSKNAKRLLVWLLLLTMVFGLLPMAAFADEAVVEPVVSEEPVQEPEPSSEPTEAPSEPTQEPEPEQPGDADVTIEGDEEQPEDELDTAALVDYSGYQYSIVMVDCGRKYFNVDSINAIIDSASAAGMHYVMLAVGNDGLRFLLNDMSLTVNGMTYDSQSVSAAIHTANKAYDNKKSYNPYTLGDTSNEDVEELTENDMNAIMLHANDKGVQIIPLINTPGHMDTILSAATKLTGINCAYSTSSTTIDLSNSTAVEFTKALLQKYIDYFAGKGCKFFNMGADEYANDISGNPTFNTSMYSSFITYINTVAGKIKAAGMTPMAFNDGIYYAKREDYGTIDTSILVCYWSKGWSGYDPAEVNYLINKGFKVINTNGDYYWVLGKGKCTADKAKEFVPSVFNGCTATNENAKSIAGAMFCIWSDEPNEMSCNDVSSQTANVINSFGSVLPKTVAGSQHNLTETTPGGGESGGGESGGGSTGGGESGGGSTGGETQKPDVTVKLKVGETSVHYQDGNYSSISTADDKIATVDTSVGDKPGTGTTTYERATVGEGKFYISTNTSVDSLPDTQMLTFESTSGGKYYIKNAANNKYIHPARKSIMGWPYYYVDERDEQTQAVTISGDAENGYIISNGNAYLIYDTRTSEFDAGSWSSASTLYLYTKKTTPTEKQTTITFTGVKPGTTTCQIGDTLYKIIVDYKQETVNAFVGGTKTVEGVSGEPDTTGLDTGIATVSVADGVMTVTGVAAGETSVIVGGTKYTITVTAEDLSTVTPLTLEYWITNGRVKDSSTDKTTTEVSALTAGIATSGGVDASSLVAKPGKKDGRDVLYWQCRLLDKTKANSSTSGTEQQTEQGGDDDTSSGVGFTKIRYYNGAWAVYTENFEWVAVESTHQLVAYYCEHIKVSDEIESYAADWGNRGDGTPGGWLDVNSYCTLSMQVVYEDGTTNPTGVTATELKSKTIVYGYWATNKGRGIGTVLLEGKEYEIYKVTSETGAAEAKINSSDGVVYKATVNKFTWDNNEMTVWESDEPSSSVTIHNPSTLFDKEGINANLCWDENQEAILLRVYVRAKATEDSLTVHYVETQNNRDFYSYNIAVAQNTVFDAGFAKQGDGLVNNTVVNIKGQTQTVQSDLSVMQEVGAQYKYANYTFDRAVRSQDGKEVFLYYSFTRNKSFVVDFGLPLEIKPTDLSDTLAIANIEQTVAESTSFAKITVNNPNIKYELIKTLDQNDIFSVNYSGTNLQTSSPDGISFTIEVIPATSVYYEDSFAKFANGKNTASGAKWSTVGTEDVNATQALSAIGDTNRDVYGYDNAYEKCSTFSLGSAQMVTVNSDMLTNWDANSAWPTASFTFKGTGFDIISLTNNQSGTIFVDVVRTSDNQKVKGYIVDNYYGYKQENGTWVVDPNSKDTLYQIPVIKASGLDYNEYTVTVKVVYGAAADHTGKGYYSFWFDAFRVYNPMGLENNYIEEYVKDNEGYPQYIKLRDQLLNNSASATKMLFIDGAANASVADYKNFGPNNEVYLAAGQAISFTINGESVKSIQIGAKAPNGVAVLNVNGAEIKTLDTATEMYYDITEQATNGSYKFTITNNGNNILSLTNIKITFGSNATASLAELGEDDAVQAVSLVRSLYAAPVVEPVEPFKPEHFEAKWSNNVRQGGRAVLTVKTSADVEQIIINGDIVVSNYKTRTERVGYGWNAERVTYHVFTYMISAQQSAEYSVVAVNGAGLMSEAVTARLTVRPKGPIKDWFDGLFGRWF